MLSEQSYLMALVAYTGAALLSLLLLAWWLHQFWRPAWIALLVLVGAALALTPAYPEQGIATMAPALIVAVFQWFNEGQAAAEHALWPLGYALAAAVALSLLLGLTVLRSRRPRPAPTPGAKA
ncbi:MAG: hypothetical protein ACK5HY_12555 [Parahaliea sp.]